MGLISKADDTAENYQYWALCFIEKLQASSSSASDTEEAGDYRTAASEAADKLRDLKRKFRAAVEAFEESLKARAGPPPCAHGAPRPGGVGSEIRGHFEAGPRSPQVDGDRILGVEEVSDRLGRAISLCTHFDRRAAIVFPPDCGTGFARQNEPGGHNDLY